MAAPARKQEPIDGSQHRPAHDEARWTDNDIGALVRRRREALDWSSKRLAKEVGATREAIEEMERAIHTAPLGLVLECLRVMGVHVFAQMRERTYRSIASEAHDTAPTRGNPAHDADLDALIDDVLNNL